VPAAGTGIGMQEMIKTTAARSPTSGLKERSFLASSFNLLSPRATNGTANDNQITAHPNGRIPSEICIA
jgi:hypothetical protein